MNTVHLHLAFRLDYSEHVLSSEDMDQQTGSPRKADKRKAVCEEMLETEANYLKALKMIVQVCCTQLYSSFSHTVI